MPDSTAHQEFLITDIQGHLFAFDTHSVGAALAPRPVTPLPFVGDHIEGLINVNDQVLTLINLSTLFALGTGDSDRSELLVLDTQGLPCAVRVQQIRAKVTIEQDALRAVSGDATADPHDGDDIASLDSQIATARFEHEGQNVLVINPVLLGNLLAAGESPEGQPGFLGKSERRTSTEKATETCLHFTCSNEHYAMALADVVEILDSPKATPLPGAPGEVEGLIAVRDDVLLVVSLGALLGLATQHADSASVIVIEAGERQYGLRVDAVLGMESYTAEQLRPIDNSSADIHAVLMTEQHLVGLLSPEQLISKERQQRLISYLPARKKQQVVNEQVYHDFLEVRLGRERLGIPLDSVSAIAERQGFEAIEHHENSWVCGAVHLKDDILPVVDYGALLHCEAHTAIDDDNAQRGAWVVVSTDAGKWAIPVAEAQQIRRITEDDIDPVEDGRQRFIDAIANREGGLMPILSLKPLAQSA